MGKLDRLSGRMDNLISDVDTLIQRVQRSEDVELALLHDAIVQIYHLSKVRGKVFVEDYQRACELYKYNGKSVYIETIMEELEELYKKTVRESREE